MTSTLYDTTAELSATADRPRRGHRRLQPGALGLASQARELLADAHRRPGRLRAADARRPPPGRPPACSADLRANRRPGITDANQLDVQALASPRKPGNWSAPTADGRARPAAPAPSPSSKTR